MATVFSQKMAHVLVSAVGREMFTNSYVDTYTAIASDTDWDSFGKDEREKKDKEFRAEATLGGLTAVALDIFPDTLHEVITDHIFSSDYVSDIIGWQCDTITRYRNKNHLADTLDNKFRDRIVKSLPPTWKWGDEPTAEFDTTTGVSHEVLLARVRHLAGELERVREERERAIVEAVKAGVSVSTVGKAAGLTPQAVYSLRRRRLYRNNK